MSSNALRGRCRTTTRRRRSSRGPSRACRTDSRSEAAPSLPCRDHRGTPRRRTSATTGRGRSRPRRRAGQKCRSGTRRASGSPRPPRTPSRMRSHVWSADEVWRAEVGGGAAVRVVLAMPRTVFDVEDGCRLTTSRDDHGDIVRARTCWSRHGSGTISMSDAAVAVREIVWRTVGRALRKIHVEVRQALKSCFAVRVVRTGPAIRTVRRVGNLTGVAGPSVRARIRRLVADVTRRDQDGRARQELRDAVTDSHRVSSNPAPIRVKRGDA